MLKNIFESKVEIELFIELHKVYQAAGKLTRSERDLLAKMIAKPGDYIHPTQPISPNVMPIVTNRAELSFPCVPVTEGDFISHIIDELKATLAHTGGLGLSANQIGYCKQIAYVRIPQGINKETKTMNLKETILINPKIIEHDKKVLFKGEKCLSFKGIAVDTDRYIFITVQNCNDRLEPSILMAQDLESIVMQHEIAHLNGKTLFDFKHRSR